MTRRGFLGVTAACLAASAALAKETKPAAERIAILREAVRLGADYVDVEAATDSARKAELRTALAGGRTQLISSWHDFSGTPGAGFLRTKLAECMAEAPAIVKIVTYADAAADCLRVLELIPRALAAGQAICAFSMGEAGKISRVAAPLLGSAIEYASLDEEQASAPGQFTIREIREILAGVPVTIEGPDNLPGVPLPIPSITRKDLDDLENLPAGDSA
jgi:3-dehydroquinate dehydratase type I